MDKSHADKARESLEIRLQDLQREYDRTRSAADVLGIRLNELKYALAVLAGE